MSIVLNECVLNLCNDENITVNNELNINNKQDNMATDVSPNVQHGEETDEITDAREVINQQYDEMGDNQKAVDIEITNDTRQKDDAVGENQNCAADNSKKDCIMKENTVAKDVENQLFPLKVIPSKRRGKIKQLKLEDFDHNVYSKNQTGFVTYRPVRWLMALEKYICECNTSRCRWRYKADKVKAYTEAYLLIFYDNTKKIEVTVQFITGAILVIGENYKEWVLNEFPKVQKYFEELNGGPDEFENNSDEIALDVEALFKRTEEINNAVNVQDEIIQKLIGRCRGYEVKVNEYDMQVDSIVKTPALFEVEQRIDEKISVFMNTTLEHVDRKIENLKTNLFNEINCLKSKLGELTVSIQNQKPEIANDEINSCDNIRTEIDNIDFNAKIDIEGIKSSVKFDLDMENETQLRKIQEFESRIDNLDKDLLKNNDDHNNQMAHFEVKFKKLSEDIMKIRTNNDIMGKPDTNLFSNIQSNKSRVTTHSIPVSFNIDNNNGTTSNASSSFIPDNNQIGTHAPENLEILMCFDSNGKYLDRKKLWRVKDSEFRRCSTLSQLSQLINNYHIKDLKYILISVGTNDLDDKDHLQVLDEMKCILSEIRYKYPGIKIIINEFTPRKDSRDREVQLFNHILGEYAKNHGDITIASQYNMRDPTFSMIDDDKHVKQIKIPKYASNIIRALKAAYDIKSKSDLYFRQTPDEKTKRYTHSNNINNRMQTSTGYEQIPNNQELNPHYSDNLNNRMQTLAGYDPTRNNQENKPHDTIVRDIMMKLGEYIQKCV